MSTLETIDREEQDVRELHKLVANLEKLDRELERIQEGTEAKKTKLCVHCGTGFETECP